MPLRRRFAVLAVPCCLMSLAIAGAQEPNALAPTKRIHIDDQADKILRRMSTYLGSAAEFSFQVTNMVDHVLDNGQKIQLCHRMSGKRQQGSRPHRSRRRSIVRMPALQTAARLSE